MYYFLGPYQTDQVSRDDESSVDNNEQGRVEIG